MVRARAEDNHNIVVGLAKDTSTVMREARLTRGTMQESEELEARTVRRTTSDGEDGNDNRRVGTVAAEVSAMRAKTAARGN